MTNETKWTPGPWEVRHWDGDDWPEKRTSIASKRGHKEALFINARYAKNVQANANLIAAAPDLYEALKYVRRFVKPEDVDTEFLDAALAKARGEHE